MAFIESNFASGTHSFLPLSRIDFRYTWHECITQTIIFRRLKYQGKIRICRFLISRCKVEHGMFRKKLPNYEKITKQMVENNVEKLRAFRASI